MVTRILDTRKADAREEYIEAARLALAAGGVVAMPTDTVYGLGARADEDKAVRKLFEVKRRKDDNPLPILLPDVDGLELAAAEVPGAARALASEFWPGPLTIVLPKADAISDLVTAGRPSVGLRVPDHPVALAVLRACEFLVAVTSANRSALAPSREFDEVRRDFTGKIDLILAADRCPGGVPSTVVDLTGDTLRIVRAGSVTAAEIREVLGRPDNPVGHA